MEFDEHPARGRFNSAFFWVMGGYINWHMRKARGRLLPTFRRPWSSWVRESARTCATCRPTRA